MSKEKFVKIVYMISPKGLSPDIYLVFFMEMIMTLEGTCLCDQTSDSLKFLILR